MPDTVLATMSDGRVVTRSGFMSAWKRVEPPARPDSLTPQGARRFLDLLVGKEALAAAALRERWVWTARESAEYLALRDHLTLQVVLDSTLQALRAARQARGDSALSAAALGEAARDLNASALEVRFDAGVLERLARDFAAVPRPSADSGMFAQLRVLGTSPTVAPADTGRVVARTRSGDWRAADVLRAWEALSPIYRPRIERAAQLEDVIRNQLFERELRRAAVARRLEERPDIAAALARKREFFAVEHLVAREVYARIAMDSVTLRRHFETHRSFWDLPLRVALTRLMLSSREAATALAVQLAQRATAESLATRARRSGVNYDIEVSAESDSALFAAALRAGPGAVLGPEPRGNGWQVARVLAVNPPRSRSFAECRTLVAQRWYGLEGERLMVELLDRVTKAARPRWNEAEIARLASP